MRDGYQVFDDEGNSVALLMVSAEEAEDIVEAWNKVDSPMRWNQPFHHVPVTIEGEVSPR